MPGNGFIKNYLEGLIALSCLLLAAPASRAQNLTPARMSFTQLYLETRVQPQQNLKNSTGEFGVNALNLGAVIPLYKRLLPEKSAKVKKLGTFLSPSVVLSSVRLDYLGGRRILLNMGMSLGGYYQTGKNSFSASVRGQINEDEDTFEDPDPRYNGHVMYVRRSSDRFSWHLGMAYTFLFGNVDKTGYLLPVFGARIKIGQYSKLIFSVPYAIRFSRYISPRAFFGLHLQPQGGINRVRNNMNFATADQVVMLRRRAFLLGAGLYVPAANNVIMGVEASLVLAQKLSITSEDRGNNNVYAQDKINNGYQLSARFIWRPWQNKLRNKPVEPDKQNPNYEISDDDFLLGF